MTDTALNHPIAAAHQAHFGMPATVTAAAPGRVNLMGEHTDYNGGFVLPIALKGLGVNIAASHGTTPGQIDLRSETFDAAASRTINETRADHWSDYILGCVAAVARSAVAEHGLSLTVSTTIPLGAGLSSSAALEVATLRAVTALFDTPLSAVEIAVTAKSVENNFVGVPCGIMDQFTSSVGTEGQALFLNTATLDYQEAPALPGHAFVVIDSGVSHQLTDGGYAQRVAECKAAREALGVDALSDLGPADMTAIDALPDPLNRRARHIVTDNDLAQKGLTALRNADAARFGALMVQSHATARDNYQITVPQTDALAEAALTHGALGARQTGGGWGGAVVALVPQHAVDAFSAGVTSQFPTARIIAIT